MGSPQDFRSLQARFQASQPESKKPLKPEFKVLKKIPQPELSEHPKKGPEFSVGPRKAPQHTDPPRKPPQNEFADGPRKFPQLRKTEIPDPLRKSEFLDTHTPKKPEFMDPPRKPEIPDPLRKPEIPDPSRKPEFTDPPRKPEIPDPLRKPEIPDPSRKPEFTDPSRKPKIPDPLRKPEIPDPSRKPEFTDPPRKFEIPDPLRKPEIPDPSRKPEFTDPPRMPEIPGPSRKSEFLDHPKKLEFIDPQRKPEVPDPLRKPEIPGPLRKSQFLDPPRKPDFPDNPRKFPQPEFRDPPRKPRQPEFAQTKAHEAEGWAPSRHLANPLLSPRRPLQQPDLGTPLCPRKPLMSEPTEVPSQLEPTELPRKSSQLSLSESQPQSPKLLVADVRPKKALQLPESGSPQRKSPAPWQSDHPHRAQGSGGVLGKQLQLQGLPRTASEPEFPLFPGTQPHWQPQARLQRRPEAEIPSKARLPASVSESSLPSAMGVLGRHKPGALPSGGSRWSLQAGPPAQRPLPSLTSLGPPPPKPPLPPGLRNIQRFQSYLGPISTVRRSHSAAGTLGLVRPTRQPRPDTDEIYEMYDDVELQDEPRPKGAEEAAFVKQPPRWPPQEPEVRKEKVPPPLPPIDPKTQKQMRKAEKAEREFRKKFKFEGEIVIQTKMMIDPNAKTRRGGGKHLGIRRGEILEVIEFTNKDEMLCRDAKGKYGYVPRTALLPLETEVYDDVAFWDPLDNQPIPQGR